MAKFVKFEDIQAWQHARELSKKIYIITSPEKFGNDYALIRQIRRSSGSIMDNIAEGFGRGGNKEFVHFLQISMGSAFELKSQLYRAIGQSYISNEEFRHLFSLADSICKMINGLTGYLKKSPFRGSKYNYGGNGTKTANYEPKTPNQKPTTPNQKPTTKNHEPETNNQQPTTK